MALRYQDFAAWILTDLARRRPSREVDRVVFEGYHISHHLVLPPKQPEESDDDYRNRALEFQRSLPRGTDFSYRIALAFKALSIAGDKGVAAAQFILEGLESAAQQSHTLVGGSAGIESADRPLEFPLGKTKRNRRSRQKTSQYSTEDPRVETIRTQALRFIRKSMKFDQLFEREFKQYRATYCRDAEWYAEEETELCSKLRDCEEQLGPTDPWTAMTTTNLAHLLFEQGKVLEAETVYRLALERWKSASPVSDERRREAILLIEQAIKQCYRRPAQHHGRIPAH